MTWNETYWGILNQLYWAPRFIGLSSIQKRHWKRSPEDISVPSEMVNTNGPLYTRGRNSRDVREYLSRQEVILNQFFDITFAIAADEVLSRLFCSPLGFVDRGPFSKMSDNLGARYGWGESENVTQPDGFYVSNKSLIGVELKLGSSSWPEQVLKYAAVMAWEEQYSGTREHLGLLYIIPDAAQEKHWSKCGLEGPHIDSSFLDRVSHDKLPKRVLDLLLHEKDRLSDVLERLSLAVVSWSFLGNELLAIEEALDQSHRGDQTLKRLLAGFRDQIENHQGTGVKAVSPASL